MSFTIMTDTSANLPEDYLQRHDIRCIPYTFMIDGKELGEDFVFEGGPFYDDMRRGKIVTTSPSSSASLTLRNVAKLKFFLSTSMQRTSFRKNASDR